MLTLVALAELHVRVVSCPASIGFGDAEMLTDTGSTTVTLALSVAVPDGPVAVMVYVVVTIGETLMEPVADTVPIPWSILTDVAFRESHVNVVV